jgi:hypothetical protein
LYLSAIHIISDCHKRIWVTSWRCFDLKISLCLIYCQSTYIHGYHVWIHELFILYNFITKERKHRLGGIYNISGLMNTAISLGIASSILRQIWLKFMALCLVFIRRLFQFSHFFFRISNFCDLNITEETWVVEMRIWCIKIVNVLVLHFNPSVGASTGGLLVPEGLYSPVAKYFGTCFKIRIWIELSRKK